MIEILEQKAEDKKNRELLLPRKKEVIISDNFLFREKVCFEGEIFSEHYRLTFSTQFKPLSFLGEYASTFVTTGLYSEKDLDEMNWLVKPSAPHYLKLRVA